MFGECSALGSYIVSDEHNDDSDNDDDDDKN